jgi:hypothetical protein
MSGDWTNWSTFIFNSVSILAIIVGTIVFWYRKFDNLRNISSIVVIEIDNAEKMMRGLRDTGTILSSQRFFYTNNWSANIHLFTKILDHNEIEAINKLYSTSTHIDKNFDLLASKYIDLLVTHLSAVNLDSQKNITTLVPVLKRTSQGTYEESEYFTSHIHTPSSNKTIIEEISKLCQNTINYSIGIIINDYIIKFTPIFGTSTYIKLKKIADSKFFWFF